MPIPISMGVEGSLDGTKRVHVLGLSIWLQDIEHGVVGSIGWRIEPIAGICTSVDCRVVVVCLDLGLRATIPVKSALWSGGGWSWVRIVDGIVSDLRSGRSSGSLNWGGVRRIVLPQM